VILGAGASAPLEVPTLRNLFKDAQARAHLRRDDFLRTKLEALIWEPRGHTLETSQNSLTVEEVLTLLRDSEKQPYGLTPLLGPDLDRFRRGLYVLIKKATYDAKSSSSRHLNPLTGC